MPAAFERRVGTSRENYSGVGEGYERRVGAEEVREDPLPAAQVSPVVFPSVVLFHSNLLFVLRFALFVEYVDDDVVVVVVVGGGDGGGSAAAQLRVFGIGNPETANRRRRINRGPPNREIPAGRRSSRVSPRVSTRGFEHPGFREAARRRRRRLPSPELPGNFVAVRRSVHYPSFPAKSILCLFLFSLPLAYMFYSPTPPSPRRRPHFRLRRLIGAGAVSRLAF